MTFGRTTSGVTGRPVGRRWTGLLAVMAITMTLTACTGEDASPSPEPSVPQPSVATEGSPPAPEDAPTDSSDTDAADRDACDLLPAEALNETLGEEAQATAIPSDGWIAGQCTWSSPSAGFIMSIGTAESIESFGDPAEPDAEAKVEAFRARAQDGAARDVENLGDGGVVGPTGLATHVNGTYVEFENLSLAEEQLIEVARLAVSNLAG